jgi:hypothetical protein
MWWKLNPAEARNYAQRAAEFSVRSIDKIDDSSISEKLKKCEKTIQILAEFDEKMSRMLAEKIARILEAKGKSGGSNADSFVLIAINVVDANPTLAFNLGVKSLTYGNALKLNGLISKLNFKNPILAENLFQLSLGAAKRNYSYEFTGGLGIVVFQERDGKVFSATARRSYLELLADMISRGALIESEQRVGCEVAPLATSVLDRFDEYMPDRSLTVRQHIQICIPFSHGYTAEIAKAEVRGDEPKTVDEFIRAARETNDPGLKGRYFFRAIFKLKALEKFDDIITLLDDMTEVEIKAIGLIAWESWRIEYAFESALVSFESKDIPAVYRTINRTPKKYRPYVRFRLAYKLSVVEHRDFILENLEEIRKEIASLDSTPKDAAGDHISLARLYVKVQPTESESVFRDAVKYINKADADNPEFLPEKDYAPLQDYVRLPFELLDSDESGINSSLGNVSSRRSRIRLKLGFLESSIQKLTEIKKKVELENLKLQGK